MTFLYNYAPFYNLMYFILLLFTLLLPLTLYFALPRSTPVSNYSNFLKARRWFAWWC